MGILENVLRKLQDVSFVTRPLDVEDSYLSQSEEGAMAGFPTKPAPDMTNKPLNQAAFGGMEDLLNMQTKGDETPLPEPDAAIESPMKKKLKYLDTMRQSQKMRSNPLKPMQTLVGGEGGSGIY